MNDRLVNDASDPRLSLYLNLRDRDIRRETGLFLAEGEHVVRRAFEAGLRVRSVLVVEGKADRVQAMIAALPSPSDVSLDGVLGAAGASSSGGVCGADGLAPAASLASSASSPDSLSCVAQARRLHTQSPPKSSLETGGRRACATRLQPERATEVLVCSKEVMAAAVGFDLHRGVIAAVEPPRDVSLDEVLGGAGASSSARVCGAGGLAPAASDAAPAPAPAPTPLLATATVIAPGVWGGVVVVCPEITNVENLGLLVRVCAGLGVRAMVLGPRCCDPWYRRAVRVSMGAVFTMPMVRSVDMEADLRRLREDFGCELVATVIDEDAQELRSARRGENFPGGTAILLGSEGDGLPAEIVEQCDRKVRIPMSHGVDSLNVAVAAGIVVHHFVGLQAEAGLRAKK